MSALAYAPPGTLDDCPAGAVVSGSRDKSVMVWDVATSAPVQKLEGHEYQVRRADVIPHRAQGSGLGTAVRDP